MKSIHIVFKQWLCMLLMGVAVALSGGCSFGVKQFTVEHTAQEMQLLARSGGDRVLVLQPVVDYKYRSFSNDPASLPLERRLLRASIYTALSQQIRLRGHFVVSHPTPKVMPAVNFLTRRLLGNYVQLMNQREYSVDPLPVLGPSVNQLTSPLQGDLLLISRFRGVKKSPGKQRKDKLVAAMRSLVTFGQQTLEVLPSQHGELEAAMLDGVDGQVIWSGRVQGDVGELELMIDQLLETLPTITTLPDVAELEST